ncbi:hypothetical protein ACSU1N_05065 [Thermogladius sp. 4427co]|uniref:hypothetical protein n=1 Tax=Thermogladius sp. 4427co TaxID=3450718 RepID=UPI003F79150F
MYKSRVIDYRYFPYLVSSDELAELTRNVPLEALVNNPSSPIRSELLSRLRKIVVEGVLEEPKLSLELEIALFYAMIAVLKSLGYKRLYPRIAVVYSKSASNLLKMVDNNILVGIASKIGLNTRLEYPAPRIPIVSRKRSIEFKSLVFSLDLKSYLKIVSHRLGQDPKYNISSNIVYDKRVFVDRDVFVRVLEEAIYHYVMRLFDTIDTIAVDEELKRDISEIVDKAGIKPESAPGAPSKETFGKGVLIEEAFPPCIKRVLDRLRAGENLSHPERFLIATFLINIGMDIDAIVDLFRNAPDFNERITRYQVEHLAGLRGKKQKYLPYNCDKLKSLSICPIAENCQGDNPLSTYYKNLKTMKSSNVSSEFPSERVSSVDKN